MSFLDLTWLNPKSKLVEKPVEEKKAFLPQPEPCNQEVWQKGIGVFVVNGGTSQAVEGLVQRCASDLKLKVDWSYMGGRAIVRVVGEEWQQTLVAEWMERHLPMEGYRI